jgi:hypothetical protein
MENASRDPQRIRNRCEEHVWNELRIIYGRVWGCSNYGRNERAIWCKSNVVIWSVDTYGHPHVGPDVVVVNVQVRSSSVLVFDLLWRRHASHGFAKTHGANGMHPSSGQFKR